MKNYKTPAEQRAKMTAYYYKNRERILEYQLQQREKEQQHKLKQYSNLIEMYESWNYYILERLQSPKKLPKWIRRGMELQWLRNKQILNQYEQNGQNCNTR
jgi:hypothetical protein